MFDEYFVISSNYVDTYRQKKIFDKVIYLVGEIRYNILNKLG